MRRRTLDALMSLAGFTLPDLNQYAGQQLTTGAQAKAYADRSSVPWSRCS